MIEVHNENDYSKAIPFFGTRPVLNMTLKEGYFPGHGLGKNLQGIKEPPPVILYPPEHGLGYESPLKNIPEEERDWTSYIVPITPPYRKTLNGYFVCEGENFPYFMFPEPWIDHRGKRHPGFEIVNDCDPYSLVQTPRLGPLTRLNTLILCFSLFYVFFVSFCYFG